MRTLYLFSLVMVLTACDVNVNVKGDSAPPVASAAVAQAAAPVITTGAPYEFSPSFALWINDVGTNGASRDSATSVYSCTGGGGGYIYGNAIGGHTIYLGFYRDGTMSFADDLGHSNLFHTESMAGVDTFLKRTSDNVKMYDLTHVNYSGYPQTLLDAQDHLQYVEVQTFLHPGVDDAMDSGSIWTCSLAGV